MKTFQIAGKIQKKIQKGHGLDKPSPSNFSSCIGYRKTFLIATSKIFERFCIEISKAKYCNEHTKGYSSQSSYKEVTYYVQAFLDLGCFVYRN